MTDKELRKLRRIELLELLVEQGEEMERLRGQLQKAQEALQERTIVIQKAGSLAEAALRLNGVFTAADQAARDYVDSQRTMEAQQRAKVASIEKEAREKADQMLSETREKCRAMEQETLRRCRELTEQMCRQAGRSQSGQEEDAP